MFYMLITNTTFVFYFIHQTDLLQLFPWKWKTLTPNLSVWILAFTPPALLPFSMAVNWKVFKKALWNTGVATHAYKCLCAASWSRRIQELEAVGIRGNDWQTGFPNNKKALHHKGSNRLVKRKRESLPWINASGRELKSHSEVRKSSTALTVATTITRAKLYTFFP